MSEFYYIPRVPIAQLSIPGRASDAGPDERPELEEDDCDMAYDRWVEDQE